MQPPGPPEGDRISAPYPDARPPLVLRPYRRACVDACLKALSEGVTRMVVHLGTGLGKGNLRASLIPDIPAPRPGAGEVLVIAHREELIDQLAATIRWVHSSLRVGTEMAQRHADPDDDVIGEAPGGKA